MGSYYRDDSDEKPAKRHYGASQVLIYTLDLSGKKDEGERKEE